MRKAAPTVEEKPAVVEEPLPHTEVLAEPEYVPIEQ
jgi:hypothetical protein